MNQSMKLFVAAIMMVLVVTGFSGTAMAAPEAGGGGGGTVTAISGSCQQPTFFSFPTWYRYLGVKQKTVEVNGTKTTVCEPRFSLMKNNTFNGTSLLLLTLGIIDILIRLAALVSVIFVIYGGFRYMMSQGSPEGTKAAQATVLNALIGLVVAILAASIVSFIGFSIG